MKLDRSPPPLVQADPRDVQMTGWLGLAVIVAVVLVWLKVLG